MNRQTFLIRSVSTLTTLFALPAMKLSALDPTSKKNIKPLVISTWSHGFKANIAAWEVLIQGGRALDAVETGVMVTELDPEITSVGYGSNPDRDGIITLDACIMDELGNCGSVAFLQHIMTPVSVARQVMEKTPHVMLADEGALQFALAHGFKREDLHTAVSKQNWESWKKNHIYDPVDVNNHDTISMLAIDKNGNISGACSTGGLAFKHHGRVGDSPVIGAGLFVDNEIGGAGATGVGEVVLKTLGTHLIVELMRNGASPQDACKEAVMRALKKVPGAENLPVYYIAVNKQGEYGSYGTNKEFEYAVYTESKGNILQKADQ